MLSWVVLGTLLAVCGVLGVLQYRWIGEVSRAERDRLRASLQASLQRLSQDFNQEIATEVRAFTIVEPWPELSQNEAAAASRYQQWRRTTRRGGIFRRIAIMESRGDTALLRVFDPEKGVFRSTEWPEEWLGLRNRAAPGREMPFWQQRGRSGAPPAPFPLTIELPLRGTLPAPGRMPGPFERRVVDRLILELEESYMRDVMLPELLQRHLGGDGNLSYEVAVLTRGPLQEAVYPPDPSQARRIAAAADASVFLFEPQAIQMMRPPWAGGPPQRGREPTGGPGPGVGRWQMFARHRAGSLEEIVTMARRRNLAVTAGVMLLLLASVCALVLLTRRAQRLAQLQMEFVAGVSHELKTPLTVIHTAAYNLRGKLANDPGQVEKYGALIQRESGRLADMVDQVMQFAGSEVGRPVQDRDPLFVDAIIEDAVESSRAVVEAARCVVERAVNPDLPPVVGDPVALRRVFSNLLSNAAKHGAGQDRWIGVFASTVREGERDFVEVRVADRGPGIPADEHKQIFEPFFRGRRAVQDQVHGSGLGLNLVKKIVEGHGGTVRVRSEPGRLTEFIVRLPALARE